MRKLLLLLFFIPLISFSQNKFNGAKYVYYANNFTEKGIKNYVKTKGFTEINIDQLYSLDNPCEAIIFHLDKEYNKNRSKTFPYRVDITIRPVCDPLNITEINWGGRESYSQAIAYSNTQGKGVFANLKKELRYYKYDPQKTQIYEPHKYSDHFSFNNEKSIREYLDNTGLDPIEGIWEYGNGSNAPSYKILIFYEDYKYVGYLIEESRWWLSGDKKLEFETAVSDEILTMKWTMSNMNTVNKFVASIKDNSVISLKNLNDGAILYKVHPKFGERRFKKGEWSGNGSGLIISKEGYIVTNHHVIDRSSLLEVEFKNDDGVKKYKAEVINSDESTDLAILKIVDENFRGFDETPNYNFETELADVGNRVYAYGYPMALSIMGKEIKITDGLINSKTGYKGDVKTYQISAPIQGGNSGGPLFNEDGDFVGVNSSGLTKEVADNVGYSIKSNYVLNLINALPEKIELPYSYTISWLSTEKQIKRLSQYVVLVKVQR